VENLYDALIWFVAGSVFGFMLREIIDAVVQPILNKLYNNRWRA
jgi:hypothetical protein